MRNAIYKNKWHFSAYDKQKCTKYRNRTHDRAIKIIDHFIWPIKAMEDTRVRCAESKIWKPLTKSLRYEIVATIIDYHLGISIFAIFHYFLLSPIVNVTYNCTRRWFQLKKAKRVVNNLWKAWRSNPGSSPRIEPYLRAAIVLKECNFKKILSVIVSKRMSEYFQIHNFRGHYSQR